METTFKIWKTSRNLFKAYLDNYTLNQLNKIPNGFSNNLIWNIGHVIVAQQRIIYTGFGLETYTSEELFDRYKPGTKPTGMATQAEVDELRELLMSLIDITEKDYYDGRFLGAYNERTTLTGFHLNALQDAFEYNNYHEALHLGCMKSIGKFI